MTPPPQLVANTVSQLLAQRVATTPHAPAFYRESIHGGWESITWQDFEMRAAKLSRSLHAAGLRKGGRLALIAPVSLEWELLHHAAMAMGVAIVGLDTHDLPDRIAAMCTLADVTAIATSNACSLARFDADRLLGAKFVLDLGMAAGLADGIRRLTWSELNRLGDSMKDAPETPRTSEIATIIFTSGATGTPKGITYTHAQLCLATAGICESFPFIGANSCLLCWLPLSNLFQRMVNLAALRSGAATYLLGDPHRIMAVVADVSPEVFIGVPRFYEKLYQGIQQQVASQPAYIRGLVELAMGIARKASQRRRQRQACPFWLQLGHQIAELAVLRRIRGVMGARIRCMITGSAPTPGYLLEEFDALGWLLLEAYGLSENVLPMAMNLVDDFRFGTVGRPLQGNEIIVGENGAIKVRGQGVFAGYLGDAEKASFDKDGFYTTGDLGQFDVDGYLKLIGRTTDLIKTSTGRRVAPAPVEALLQSIPGIDQAILIGAGRKCLVALCYCTGEATTAEFKPRLAVAIGEKLKQVAEHERPTAIGVIEHPFSIERGELTSNLKLRRSVIEEMHTQVIQRMYGLLDQQEKSTTDHIMII